jgi:hypothetical protein
MLSLLSKFFLSSSLDVHSNALRDYSSEGHFVNFVIDFDSNAHANAMMFSILEMQHEKTIHAILKIEQTSLSVSIQHSSLEDQNSVMALVSDINRKAIKIKNG